MEKSSNEISIMMKRNVVMILKTFGGMIKHPVYGFIISQLFRSVSSAGANYEEACGAESKADFVHKLHISYKELRETNYWLEILKMTGEANKPGLLEIANTTESLQRIVGKSIVTAKKRMKNKE